MKKTPKSTTPAATATDDGDRLSLSYDPLSLIQRAARNAKLHAEADLAASFGRFGMVAAVIVNDGTGRLVAGHGRVDVLVARKAAGEPPPRRVLVATDGDWLIPVLHLTFDSDAEAEAYLIADNRLGELGGHDDEVLAEILRDIAAQPGGLTGVGYSDDEVAALLESSGLGGGDDAGGGGGGGGDGTNEDHVPEPPAEPKTKDGDLWILGDHRLICGDSLNADVRARLLEGVGYVDLVLTDPPFAIYGSSTGIGADIVDDKMIRPFFEQIFRAISASIREFGHIYVHCDWRSWSAIWDAAGRAQISVKNALVWDKGSSGLGSNYANTYEMVGFFARLPPPTAMKSTTRRGQRSVFSPNLVRHNRVVGDERLHNAAKPVAMLRDLIENSSDVGEVVLDLFGGSGTTLIAAEQTRRRARVAEIEPRWCDVIVSRWERVTGKTATLARDPVAAAV